jgi:formylmethanofuran dehydrogenase subunit C
MSAFTTLSLRAPLDARLEVEGVTADRLGQLSERDIASLPVWLGARTAKLADFFVVRGGRSPRVRVEGDVSNVHGLGAGTADGELIIDGNAGGWVAAGMTGGMVTVLGSVGDDAGVGMAGGTLHVRRNAGDRLGAATPGASRGMTGGEILVRGSAGTEAAARIRRGLVIVAGDAGGHAGRAMIAGTLVVIGRTGPEPCRGSKRGSLIATGGVTVPATYRYACTWQPPFVRLLMTYLRRQYGLPVTDRMLDGLYHRYCGDASAPGKGEILALAGDARS